MVLRLKAAELGGNRPELSGRQEEPARTERKTIGAERKEVGAALEGGGLRSLFGRIADTFPFTVIERTITSFTAKSTMFH